MKSPEDVARAFYEAFKAKDGAAMAALYAPEASFSDPVFPALDGKGAGAMWRMLTAQGKDLEVSVDSLTAQGEQALVTWTARYTFSRTGRPVTNRVRSELTVKDGHIIRQQDVFDFPGWAAQAFGVTGKLLGWTGPFKKKVQATAGTALERFRQKEDGGQPAFTKEQ